MTADMSACDSLLDLISILRSANAEAHRTLAVSDTRPFKADHIFSGGHDLKVHHPERLRLSFDPDLADENALLREEGDRLEMIMGATAMQAFEAGIVDLRRGEADFSIGYGNDRDEMQRLSFWWWPNGA